jgi:hypothetical protein
MIKILYFYRDLKKINPSYNIYNNIFFNKFSCLKVEVKNFSFTKFNFKIEKKIKQFSPNIILIDYQILNHYEELKKYFVAYDKFAYLNCIKFLNFLLQTYKLPLVVFCNQDFYATQMSVIKKLNYYNSYLISPDYKFFPQKKNINPKEEKYYDKLNDNWRNYVKKNYQRVISFPHVIENNEFHKTNFEKKNIDASILGANYFYRKNAKKKLKDSDINFVTYDPLIKIITIFFTLIKIFPETKILIYIRLKLLAFYHKFFFSLLQKSKISITCGGIHKYIVRKYLEIPAYGSLLVARKCQNYQNFGFKNNKNIIFADENELITKINFFLKKKKISEKIIKSSQKFLSLNHSEIARTKQLKKCLTLIIKKNFKGSTWLNGKFKLL